MTKGKTFTGIESKASVDFKTIFVFYLDGISFMQQLHKITKVRLKNHVRLRRLSASSNEHLKVVN